MGLAVLVAIAVTAWLFVGPVSAHPGNTCDPEPGHGTPGCHVDVTDTTVAAPTTITTAVPSTVTTAAPTTVPTAASTRSRLCPDHRHQRRDDESAFHKRRAGLRSFHPVDPNVLQMFADKNNCLSCHGDPSLIGPHDQNSGPTAPSIALYVDTKGSTNSVHRYKDCTVMPWREATRIETPLTKLSLSEKCGTCHEYEYTQYKSQRPRRAHSKGQQRSRHLHRLP